MFTRKRVDLSSVARAVATPAMLWPGLRTVLVAGGKGGAGKTPSAVLLSLVLSQFRAELIALIDNNPHGGTTRTRLVPASVSPPPRRLVDLAADAASITHLPQLGEYSETVGTTRIRLITNDDVEARRRQRMTAAEYGTAREVLARYHQVMVVDGGTGVADEAADSDYAGADQLVWAVRATPDGISAAEKIFLGLIAAGHGELVARAVIVLCQAERSIDLDALDRAGGLDMYRQRCSAVVRLPFDPALIGGRIELARLRPATLFAAYELAAHTAAQFALPSLAVQRYLGFVRAVEDATDDDARSRAKQTLADFEAIAGLPSFANGERGGWR